MLLFLKQQPLKSKLSLALVKLNIALFSKMLSPLTRKVTAQSGPRISIVLYIFILIKIQDALIFIFLLINSVYLENDNKSKCWLKLSFQESNLWLTHTSWLIENQSNFLCYPNHSFSFFYNFGSYHTPLWQLAY